MRVLFTFIVVALSTFGCGGDRIAEAPEVAGEPDRNFALRVFREITGPIAAAQNEIARRRTDESLEVIEAGLKRYAELYGGLPTEEHAALLQEIEEQPDEEN